MSESTGITGFIEIFEGRLQKMKSRLKEQLSKAKHDRDRKSIRKLVQDSRKLNRSLREMRSLSAKKCPHCGEKL